MPQFSSDKHPLLTKSGALAYITFWALLVFWSAWSTVQYSGLPWTSALLDAWILHKLYALTGFTYWPFMEQTWRLRTRRSHYVSIQITAGIAVVTLVTATDIAIIKTIWPHSDHQAITRFRESLPWRVGAGLFYQVVIIMMYLLVLLNRDIRQREIAENRLRESLKESELALLKSQFSPHFLFNSLNSASYLTLTNPEKAHRMIIALSEYLRYTLRGGGRESFSTLESEIANVRRYLEIESFRFEERLQVFFDEAPDTRHLLLPSMILQPLFENAIKHGVQKSSGLVVIRTTTRLLNGMLFILVRNSLEPGSASHTTPGAGHGIRSIRERLRMHYGESAALRIDRGSDFFQVEMQIPAQHDRKKPDRQQEAL